MSIFLRRLSQLDVGRERALIATFFKEAVYSPRPFTLDEIEASVSWISAMAIKGLAAKETRSSSIKWILGKMRLPIAQDISIEIPHYWAGYYHDGPGPRVPRHKQFFLIFPKGRDPRRPRRAYQEERPDQVSSLLTFGKGNLGWFKQGFGDYNRRKKKKSLKFFKVRRPWKGDRFFDKVEKKYARAVGDLAQAFLDTVSVLWSEDFTRRRSDVTLRTGMTGLLQLVYKITYRQPKFGIRVKV